MKLVYDSEHADMRSQVVRECNGILFDIVSNHYTLIKLTLRIHQK